MVERLRDRIRQEVQRTLRQEMGGQSPFEYAEYVSATAGGGHTVTVVGEEIRGIPALRGVGSLTAGDVVLCVRSRLVPLTIVGAVER